VDIKEFTQEELSQVIRNIGKVIDRPENKNKILGVEYAVAEAIKITDLGNTQPPQRTQTQNTTQVSKK
jgi:hypothetical protein